MHAAVLRQLGVEGRHQDVALPGQHHLAAVLGKRL